MKFIFALSLFFLCFSCGIGNKKNVVNPYFNPQEIFYNSHLLPIEESIKLNDSCFLLKPGICNDFSISHWIPIPADTMQVSDGMGGLSVDKIDSMHNRCIHFFDAIGKIDQLLFFGGIDLMDSISFEYEYFSLSRKLYGNIENIKPTELRSKVKAMNQGDNFVVLFRNIFFYCKNNTIYYDGTVGSFVPFK